MKGVLVGVTLPRALSGKSVALPVEALPERVDPVDDAVELVTAVAVRRPQVVERSELRQIGEPVLGRLGHLHLARQEASIAFARKDPESLRRFFREEPRILAWRHGVEEDACCEAAR